MAEISLRRNVAANYIGQTYQALIGVLMLPVYVRYLGAESFGLVGFFGVLQAWFQLFDMGLSQTLVREAARYRGGALGRKDFHVLFRTMESVFVVLAVSGGVMLLFAAPWIATHWLKLEALRADEVAACVRLMTMISAIRLVSGPYRSVLMGFEHQVWMNGFGMVVGTIRSVAVVGLLAFVDTSVQGFFVYQLLVAGLECGFLVWRARKSLPALLPKERIVASLRCLRGNGSFALTIAFTSSVWLIVSYADRLVLSKFLSLSEYGYYAVAVTVANAVNMIGAPVGLALLPRMVGVVAAGDEPELRNLYHGFTQLICCMCFSAALLLACFSWRILWVWTGNADLANHAALPLSLYALGNAVLAVAAFPYYLQYAKGKVSLHLYGNILFLVLFVPLVVVVAARFGSVGASAVWLGLNLLYFVGWVPLVHRSFAPGMHGRWLVFDVVIPALAIAGVCLLLSKVLPVFQSRFLEGLQIGLVGLVVLFVGALAAPRVRRWMGEFYLRVFR